MSEEKLNQDNAEQKNAVETKKEEKTPIELELEETTDRFKRLMAEFENYKKRNVKEKDLLYNTVLADIVLQFLPIVDNLEKAVNAETKDENLKQGIELVLKQIEEMFKNLGIERIKTVGETFDPEVHDAVSSVSDETLGEKEVKQEVRAGYKIGLKVIRHAMVVVAN